MPNKEEHDVLLATRPTEATEEEYQALLAAHAELDCPFCEVITTIDNSQEGGDMETFTQEEVEAKISEAVTPLLAEIEGLKGSISQSEAETEIAAAVAEVEAAKKEIEDRLDAAVLDAENAKAELAAVIAFLESAVEEAAALAQYEADKAERIAAIKESTAFSDDYIAENIERWMKDSAEEFELRVADWSATSVKPAATEEVAEEVVLDTAISTVRSTASAQVDLKDSLGGLLEASRSGVNISKL